MLDWLMNWIMIWFIYVIEHRSFSRPPPIPLRASLIPLAVYIYIYEKNGKCCLFFSELKWGVQFAVDELYTQTQKRREYKLLRFSTLEKHSNSPHLKRDTNQNQLIWKRMPIDVSKNSSFTVGRKTQRAILASFFFLRKKLQKKINQTIKPVLQRVWKGLPVSG